MNVEKMSEFFTARVAGYDEHMLNEVNSCREACLRLAELVPRSARTILDVGCGTGLGLEQIFIRIPTASVVGIDLTQAMLDRLGQKYSGRDLKTICGDYFKIELG
jgi:tRNA (cmo5U34)-methyltransferase